MYIYILPACRVVGGIFVKKKRRFDPSSLFVPETAENVGRFKLPLDITTIDNTSDGFGWYFISRVGGTIFI